jgi:hypothetical protein
MFSTKKLLKVKPIKPMVVRAGDLKTNHNRPITEIKPNDNPIESESKGIREDKIREEVRKENIINAVFVSECKIQVNGLK